MRWVGLIHSVSSSVDPVEIWHAEADDGERAESEEILEGRRGWKGMVISERHSFVREFGI